MMTDTETKQVRDALHNLNVCMSLAHWENDQSAIEGRKAIALCEASLARVVEPVAQVQATWTDSTKATVIVLFGQSVSNGDFLYATPQAAAQPSQAGEWMPIETAPKDGTRYLAYALHYGQFVENHPPGHYAGDWIFDFECRHHWRGHAHSDDREATHWKTLGDQP